ncbi:MAG TPA: hypothetical protein VFK80_01735, partial [Limnochordia bacterium]|nr:hypothetical protein [Limnochordia bacterium]
AWLAAVVQRAEAPDSTLQAEAQVLPTDPDTALVLTQSTNPYEHPADAYAAIYHHEGSTATRVALIYLPYELRLALDRILPWPDGGVAISLKGGNGGNCWNCGGLLLLEWEDGALRMMPLGAQLGGWLAPTEAIPGLIPGRFDDLDGDGRLELVVGDTRFELAFDLCHACSPASNVVFAWRDGAFKDVSAQFPDHYGPCRIAPDAELAGKYQALGQTISQLLGCIHSGRTESGWRQFQAWAHATGDPRIAKVVPELARRLGLKLATSEPTS